MTKEDVLKLVNAGFTKEDIIKLAEPTPAPEEPKQGEPKTEPAKAEKPSTEPVKDTSKEELNNYIHEVVNSTFEPFKDLYANMAKLAGMPSIDNVQPKSIDDIISDFFKED